MPVRKLTPRELAEQESKERLERQQNRRMGRKSAVRRSAKNGISVIVFLVILYFLHRIGVVK